MTAGQTIEKEALVLQLEGLLKTPGVDHLKLLIFTASEIYRQCQVIKHMCNIVRSDEGVPTMILLTVSGPQHEILYFIWMAEEHALTDEDRIKLGIPNYLNPEVIQAIRY